MYQIQQCKHNVLNRSYTFLNSNYGHFRVPSVLNIWQLKRTISHRCEKSCERRDKSNSLYFMKWLYINETECWNVLP